jgi:hypothetical protein
MGVNGGVMVEEKPAVVTIGAIRRCDLSRR